MHVGKVICFLIIVCAVYGKRTNQTTIFLSNLLQATNTKYVSIYMCWCNKDIQEFQTALYARGIKNNFNHITKNVSEYFPYKNAFYYNYAYVLDATCENMQNVLMEFDQEHLFEYTKKWYILTTTEVYPQLLHTLTNLKLRLDSDVTIVELKSSDSGVSFDMWDVYNPSSKQGDKIIEKHMGNWNANYNFVNFQNKVQYDRRNMSGLTLRVAAFVFHNTKNASLEDYLQNQRYKNLDTVQKLNYVLLLRLKEMHNFSMEFIPLKLCKSVYSSDGNTDGVVECFRKNIIDVAAAGFLKAEALDAVDYIMPSYPFRKTFILKNPPRNTNGIFLSPFSPHTWYTVLVFGTIICVLMKCAISVEGRIENVRRKKSWVVTVLTTISIYCQQGTQLVPSYISGRMLIFNMLLLSALLYNYYQSAVVSTLLSKPKPYFRNIDELLNSDTELGFEKIYNFTPMLKVVKLTQCFRGKTLLQLENDLIRSRKNFRGDVNSYYYLNPQGIEKIRGGGFAYFTEAGTRYSLIQNRLELSELCNLLEIDACPRALISVMVRKNSPFKKFFTISFRKLVASGFLNREIMIWLERKPSCLTKVEFMVLSLQHTAPAIVLFSAGLALALIILIIEIYYHNHMGS